MYGSVARITTSFIDVPGEIAVAIYLAGCSIRCPDCQNKELWDRASGLAMSLETVVDCLQEHPLAEAVVFLGGEPTDQMDFLQAICKSITNKKKVLYTGREFECLPSELTDNLDMIICGAYKQELHVNKWPASSNQRVLIKDQGSWITQVT
jgi:anaerobic ribonucleoside-triphosphate reductase activating protein